MNRLSAGINGATARLRSDERLLVICGSTVMVMAGQGVVGPVLPLYARNFNVSAAVVGLTFTAFGLARLLATPASRAAHQLQIFTEIMACYLH